MLDRCREDMAFFNERIDKTVLETLTHIVDSAFERLSYTEAVDMLEKAGQTVGVPRRVGHATSRPSTSGT